MQTWLVSVVWLGRIREWMDLELRNNYPTLFLFKVIMIICGTCLLFSCLKMFLTQISYGNRWIISSYITVGFFLRNPMIFHPNLFCNSFSSMTCTKCNSHHSITEHEITPPIKFRYACCSHIYSLAHLPTTLLYI